ncbi:MAG TPA: hypothetical protein VMV05_03520 [bacterium]|nr:hypothetical protein [bacterium]
MKELITEEQANQIILALSILVTLASLGWGFYAARKAPENQRKLNWIYSVISALVGPVIWLFWLVYNSIENYYGLDSLKALKYNFLIAVVLGVLFYLLFAFAPRWILGNRGASGRK